MRRLCRLAASGRRVVRLGYLQEAQRQSLLAGAVALAYPSLYEGFGFPPLEAMAAGVPVVAASAGAIPEVVGDAAELVRAGDPAALAASPERRAPRREPSLQATRRRACEGSLVHLGLVLPRIDDRAVSRGGAGGDGAMTTISVSLAAEQLRRRVPGGIGTYTRGLLKGLAELAPQDRPRLVLVASRPSGSQTPSPASVTRS